MDSFTLRSFDPLNQFYYLTNLTSDRQADLSSTKNFYINTNYTIVNVANRTNCVAKIPVSSNFGLNANGNILPQAALQLGTSRLIALAKKGPGIHPIAIGEILRRWSRLQARGLPGGLCETSRGRFRSLPDSHIVPVRR